MKGIDGIDHINVYSKGRTELGKWLTNFARTPIELPEHGQFESIEGYWYWLGCEDERLRHLSGFAAKKFGRAAGQSIKRDDFEQLIKKAIDIKLKSNRAKMLEFAASTLPLEHYYEYSGKRIDAGYKWITDHLELRRSQLKEWALKNNLI